jgi:hypothetical protein
MYNLHFGLRHMAKYVVGRRALSYETTGQDNAGNGKDGYSNALEFSGSLILGVVYVRPLVNTGRSPFLFVDAQEK